MPDNRIHLKGDTQDLTACGLEVEAVGPAQWFAANKDDRCPDCAEVEVEGQCLVIGTLDVRIVADSRKQFAEIIGRIIDDPRAYISGWIESYYQTNRPAPRGRKTLEALEAVAENLDNLGINALDNRPEAPLNLFSDDRELST